MYERVFFTMVGFFIFVVLVGLLLATLQVF